MKIGITGQSGFIGSHLYNTLGLYSDSFERIHFCDDYFNNDDRLESFVANCDVIVHLAAMNRSENPEELYDVNVNLVEKLIAALNKTKSTPHVLFSSSSQKDLNNFYGRSKKRGQELFENWSDESDSRFTSLTIPNVFGPFGRPFYNSVIATFSYQLTHEEVPEMHNNPTLNFICVNELIDQIIKLIKSPESSTEIAIPFTEQRKLSEILKQLDYYKNCYLDNRQIPMITDSFDLNLFNTFRSYIDLSAYFPVSYKTHSDERGSFIELLRAESGGQFSYSTTKPGIIRGNHFHTRKIERFSVLRGKALIKLRKIGTEKVYQFELDGDSPAFVDMPIWYTHNIKNIGKQELLTAFWINEAYDPLNPDTYYEEV